MDQLVLITAIPLLLAEAISILITIFIYTLVTILILLSPTKFLLRQDLPLTGTHNPRLTASLSRPTEALAQSLCLPLIALHHEAIYLIVTVIVDPITEFLSARITQRVLIITVTLLLAEAISIAVYTLCIGAAVLLWREEISC